MMQRPTARSVSSLGFGALGSVAHTGQQMRQETTGNHHQFEPGMFSRASRAIFKYTTPEGVKKMTARKLQRGLEKVERMEKEQAWLRKHGSPQRVLDLPDHASYFEIKSRYQDLILDTHPDTKQHKESHAKRVEGLVKRNEAAALRAGTPNAVMPVTEPEPASFEEVREAHAMLTNPSSLYHINATNPELLHELQYFTGKEDNSIATQATKVQILAWTLFAIAASFFLIVIVPQIYERFLELIDPAFYKKLKAKEKDEALRRERGEVVNTDPERTHPLPVLKLSRPGLFLHGTPSAKDEDDEEGGGGNSDDENGDWREKHIHRNEYSVTNILQLSYWNAFGRVLKGG